MDSEKDTTTPPEETNNSPIEDKPIEDSIYEDLSIAPSEKAASTAPTFEVEVDKKVAKEIVPPAITNIASPDIATTNQVEPLQPAQTQPQPVQDIVKPVQQPQTVNNVINNSETNSQPAINKKKLIVFVSFIAISLIACVGYLIYSLSQKPDSPQGNSQSQDSSRIAESESTKNKDQKFKKSEIQYSKLKAASTKDSKLTMSIPVELKLINSNAISTVYGHKKPKIDISKDAYAGIALYSQTYDEATISQIKPVIISQYKAKSGEVYDQLEQSFKSQGVKSFEIIDIEDFKGGLKLSINSDFGYNNNKGRGVLLVLFSKDTYYSVSVVADEDVWLSNEDVFKKVVDSVKFK